MPFIEENQEEKVIIGLYYCLVTKNITTENNYQLFTEFFKTMWVKI